MYYIENINESDSVVIKLVNELLRSKYSKTTFYCHNLGGFDVVFVLKVLIDYNDKSSNEENKYKLSFLNLRMIVYLALRSVKVSLN